MDQKELYVNKIKGFIEKLPYEDLSKIPDYHKVSILRHVKLITQKLLKGNL